MLPFVSAGVVDGGFRLVPLYFLGTDVMPLSEVWNSTCWKFGGFAGGGDDGALVFSMVYIGHLYLLPLNIGISVDIGGCLSYEPMFPSLSYSAALSEHDKL